MAVDHMAPDEFLALGLDIARVTGWRNHNAARNLDDFRSKYGCSPLTCSEIWVDLQELDDEECPINIKSKPKYLLLGLRWLRKYEIEKDLRDFFGISDIKTVRKWSQNYGRYLSKLLKVSVLLVLRSASMLLANLPLA